MKLLHQIGFLVRMEANYFARHTRLLVSALVISVVPALYAWIYLSAVWNTEGQTQALAVGIVNNDVGVQYRDMRFNVGQELESRLIASQKFGFRTYGSEESARDAVRLGKLAFALIVPNGFSAQAIPGAARGDGKLLIVTSQGNNYQSATIARHFADAVGEQLNQSINEQRWALVLRDAAGSQHSVERLRDGVRQLYAGAQELRAGSTQLHSGAKQLAGGSQTLHEGVDQTTSGFKQLAAGLRTLDARRPKNNDLNALRSGAESLANGHVEFGQGLAQLQGGAKELSIGVSNYRTQSQASFFVPDSVNEGLGTLHAGITRLENGLTTAQDAQAQLQDGAKKLDTGVAALVGGVRTMGRGVRTMVEKLPEDTQLDKLADGSRQLSTQSTALASGLQKLGNGVARLEGGIALLQGALPNEVRAPDGTASGLAHSVEPVVEILAPVQRSGESFASSVIPAALWLGAAVAAFLVHVRVLPRHAQQFSAPVRFAGKATLPLLLVMCQTFALWWVMVYVLNVHVVHTWPFALTLALTASTSLVLIMALTAMLGDAGKGLAMILLAIQLTSSGSLLPVELSGGWFMQISPWLPLTWSVQAIKATMFDAYAGAWQLPLVQLFAVCVLTWLLGSFTAKWRYVRQSGNLRPALDF